MEKSRVFESIQALAEKEHILFRLGYKKGKTELNEYDALKVGTSITLGMSLCTLKGSYGIFKIIQNDMLVAEIEGGIAFKSAQLADLLKDSYELVLMAATAGSKIVERRDAEMKSNNASVGVILDAVASENADFALDWIENYINTTIRRKGSSLTKRFSPGYGGLDLSAQRDIHKALNLKKIGIGITDTNILVPEKSVIAIAGIVSG